MGILTAIRFRAEPVRSIAAGSISGTYMGVGTPIDHPSFQFFIQNLTDATLMFSLDGINDHFPLPASGFLLDDINSNKSIGNGLFLAEGDRLYVKEVGTPTTGSVYFSVFYASDN
jgi:hypothetical protein